MNIWLSYLAVFIVFISIGSGSFPFMSGSWVMLVFLGIFNILIIASHEYAVKHSHDSDTPPVVPPSAQEAPLLISIPETETPSYNCVWQGRFIRFYKHTGSGITQTSVWKRDKRGNIAHKYGPPVSGVIHCEYHFGGIHRASSNIEFENNMIKDFPVIWYRASGNRYMDFILDGDILSGTYNSYHVNGNLKRSVRLKNGLADGPSRAYSGNGAISSVYDYKEGKKEGTFCRYNNGDSIMQTGSYSGGRLSGYIRNYYTNGNTETEKYYLNNTLMFTVFYFSNGVFRGQTFTPEFKAAAADDIEIKSFKRLADTRDRLARRGMYLYDPQSNSFPRLRAICSHKTGAVLREFSCEEELINYVLNSGSFTAFADKTTAAKHKPTVKKYNNKGRLVRTR